MRNIVSAGFGLLLASTSLSLAAPPAPDLSEQAINSASLADWTARRDALARERERETAETASPGDGAAAAADGDAADSDAADNDAASREAPDGQGSDDDVSGEDVSDDDVPGDEASAEAASADEAAARPEDLPDPFMVRLQVLLDRAHASPGVIDGREGSNTGKAIRAFEEMHGLDVDGVVDEALWEALSKGGEPAVRRYELTAEDTQGRFVADLPDDYGELARLDWLGFRDPAEMLAERFHMDEAFLRRLNPDADFTAAGTSILVADPGPDPEGEVARIVVDKSKGELIAYDADDRILLMSVATIGSDDTPSPSGEMKVNGSAREPTYEYDPDKNFQQGRNTEKLTLPPGPNGPVGTVWIDLSKPTYGIHGTPEPADVGKTASHGCVRLTNWDAEALSRLVQPARTTVEFKG